ncbi:MAG: AAA family ATPase [Bacteroidota bacterium]
MFIKSIQIKNYRLFSPDEFFEITDLNIPDNQHEGSGLTIFVGENGCGKSSLLDAFALPYVSYKADGFTLADINNPENKVEIHILANEIYNYKGTMPNADYKGKGFSFLGGVRARGNRSFLSSMIVTDQKFIKADGETKPKDNTPDLRLSVNNPWSGSRFSEIEYLILDKNRTFQTRKGTYNDTRFDRLMEDLNYQYIQKENHPIDCNEQIKEVKDVRSDGIKEAIEKFSEISGNTVELNLIDNWKPFLNAYFGAKKENLQSIPLNQLGSGYEMIFSLIYSYFLSKKGNKKLIILIDEPELHLHPKLQFDFISLLLEFSKDSQVILSTHSPLFVKQAMVNKKVHVKILNKTENSVSVANPTTAVLPYVSANEVNYIAFKLATEEYHNELYGFIESVGLLDGYKEGKATMLYIKLNPDRSTREEQKILSEYIRHQIHHPENRRNTRFTFEQLANSINLMRTFIQDSEIRE